MKRTLVCALLVVLGMASSALAAAGWTTETRMENGVSMLYLVAYDDDWIKTHDCYLKVKLDGTVREYRYRDGGTAKSKLFIPLGRADKPKSYEVLECRELN